MKKLMRFIIGLSGVSLIVILLFEFVIMPFYTRQDQGIYLVDLRGKTLNNALSSIEAEGFKTAIDDTMFTNKVLPGTIIDQYPKPQMKVKKGRTVRLKIAMTEKLIMVPNLIGQSLRSAEIIMQQAGLRIDTIYTEYNPEYPKGTVAWQYPKSNDSMKRGLGLQITVSQGLPPDFYQVPNVIGLSLNQAKEHLTLARLKPGRISYHEDQDLVPYTVIDQSIKEGTVLDRSMKIDLVISVLELQDIYNQLQNNR